METLRRLTIIVRTYNRQRFAIRAMDYWADKGPAVLILDGSADPLDFATVGRYPSHVRYIHNPVGLHQRLLDAMALVDTEFVALAGDDEFYIPSAVLKCIKTLDRVADMVACCGCAMSFSYKDGFVAGRQKYQALRGYSVDAEISEGRLCFHMRNYIPSLIYAICRTAIWKECYRAIPEQQFEFFAARELLFEMLMSFAGKSQVLPELMWLRSVGETKPIRKTDLANDPSKRIDDWWNDPGNLIEHERLLLAVSEGFSKLSNEEKSPCEYRSSVAKGVEAYLDFYRKRPNRKKRVYQRPARLAKGLLKRLIPERYKTLIKSLLHKFRPQNNLSTTSLLTAAESLEASGVHVDFDELKNIESVVREFHNSRTDRGSVERE